MWEVFGKSLRVARKRYEIRSIPSYQEVFSTQRLGIHISGPGGAKSLLKYLYLDPKDP